MSQLPLDAIYLGSPKCKLRELLAVSLTDSKRLQEVLKHQGRVVLAIDGVIRAVVEEAGAGLAVQPGDAAGMAEAIRCLARDRGAARAMGAAGRAYIESHFDREMLAQKLVLLLQGMRGRRG